MPEFDSRGSGLFSRYVQGYSPQSRMRARRSGIYIYRLNAIGARTAPCMRRAEKMLLMK